VGLVGRGHATALREHDRQRGTRIGKAVERNAQPPEYYVDDWRDPAAMYEHGERTVADDRACRI
jgi:hypothetical protein